MHGIVLAPRFKVYRDRLPKWVKSGRFTFPLSGLLCAVSGRSILVLTRPVRADSGTSYGGSFRRVTGPLLVADLEP